MFEYINFQKNEGTLNKGNLNFLDFLPVAFVKEL